MVYLSSRRLLPPLPALKRVVDATERAYHLVRRAKVVRVLSGVVRVLSGVALWLTFVTLSLLCLAPVLFLLILLINSGTPEARGRRKIVTYN